MKQSNVVATQKKTTQNENKFNKEKKKTWY